MLISFLKIYNKTQNVTFVERLVFRPNQTPSLRVILARKPQLQFSKSASLVLLHKGTFLQRNSRPPCIADI